MRDIPNGSRKIEAALVPWEDALTSPNPTLKTIGRPLRGQSVQSVSQRETIVRKFTVVAVAEMK
jgi:hypothetical protein